MANQLRILIVDNDPFDIDSLEKELHRLGYQTESAVNGREALKKIIDGSSNQGYPGILITDVQMPIMDGLELMKQTWKRDPNLPIILVTKYGDIPMAVQAMHDGAYDFIEKPIDFERLADIIKRAMDKRSLVLENRVLRSAVESGIEAKIKGNSSSIVELRKKIITLASKDVNVLILGETGTGKELVAQCLHDFSQRVRSRFVTINCAAIPKGLFESELFGYVKGAFNFAYTDKKGLFEIADGGTLFLDEIGLLPLDLQGKLLRVLQDQKIRPLGSTKEISVNVRLIAATNLDLRSAVKKGDFREDLYFRLHVVEILIPPLSERCEDIPLLFGFFIDYFARKHECKIPELSPDGKHKLMTYDWTENGNIRELKNEAERYVLGMPTIIEPNPPKPLPTLPQKMAEYEKTLIEQSLIKNKGDTSAAAEDLVIPPRTLNEKMRKYGLNKKNYQ